MDLLKPQTGDFFFTVRKIIGDRQIDFAKRLDVAQSTISKVEKNKLDDVSFQLVAKLCRECGVSITSIFNENLSNYKTSKFKKMVNPEYFVSGDIDHIFVKLIFQSLNSIEKKKIASRLNYHEEYFVYRDLKFNEFFFFMVKDVIGAKYTKAIREAAQLISKESLLELEKRHYQSSREDGGFSEFKDLFYLENIDDVFANRIKNGLRVFSRSLAV